MRSKYWQNWSVPYGSDFWAHLVNFFVVWFLERKYWMIAKVIAEWKYYFCIVSKRRSLWCDHQSFIKNIHKKFFLQNTASRGNECIAYAYPTPQWLCGAIYSMTETLFPRFRTGHYYHSVCPPNGGLTFSDYHSICLLNGAYHYHSVCPPIGGLTYELF
jgi:hypothetical protein